MKLHELYPFRGPMPIVHAAGAPWEVGYKHGKECKKFVADQARLIWKLFSGPNGVNRERIIRDMKKMETTIIENFGTEYIEEMNGIATGAEISYWDVFLLQMSCWMNLLEKYGIPFEISPISEECSSFCAWGSATKHHDVIVAHNDDGPRWGQFQVCLIVTPSKGRSFLTPISVGNVGYHSMFNDAGLFIGGTSLGDPISEDKSNLLETIVYRHLIQYSSSAEEAFERFKKYDLPGAGNVIFVDSNKAIYVARVQEHMAPLKTLEDYVVVTNHPIPEEIKRYLRSRSYPSSVYRYETLVELIKQKHGEIDVAIAKEIMSSHFDWSTKIVNPSGNTICRHYEFDGLLSGTCRSGIFLPQIKTAHIALGNPCEAEWIITSFRT